MSCVGSAREGTKLKLLPILAVCAQIFLLSGIADAQGIATQCINGICPNSNGQMTISTPPGVVSATTATIGGSLLAAGGCASATVNVTGATTSMVAVASPAGDPGSSLPVQVFVSSAGVVTVRECAILAITPAAQTFNVRVIP